MSEAQTTILCPNPKCQRVHGLFWYIYKQGPKLKRQLSYRCDNAERISSTSTHEGNPIPIRTTAILMAPDVVSVPVGLPEEYTPAAAKVANSRSQMQLAIPTRRK